MATIATTTDAAPFIYASTSLFDRDPITGYLYCLVKTNTSSVYQLYRSTDNGTSWGTYQSTWTHPSVAELGPIFIAYNQILFHCFRSNESSQDRIYVKTINLGAGTGWDGETLISFPGNGGTPGSVYTGMDFVVVVTPSSGMYMPLVVGKISGGNIGAVMLPVWFDPGTGTPQYAPSTWSGTGEWLVAGSGRVTPSMDLEHVGDAKGSGTPNVWISFGRTSIQAVKASWISGGWSGPSSPVTIASSITAANYMSGRWDGTRFVMCAQNPSATSTVKVYERNQANSSTTTRTTPTHPTGVIRQAHVDYDSSTRDIRVYAVGTSTAVLYTVDFVRATGLWGAWAAVSGSPVILGSAGDNFGVRRSTFGDAKHDLYYAVSGSPNTLTHLAQPQAYAPNTPTWVSPSSGQAQDVAATLLLDWAFSDPDPADVQASYALQRQIGAGALQYYTAAGGTWGGSEVFNSTATTSVTLATSWGAGSDANYTFKVKTRDSTGLDSAYSAGLIVVPSAKVNPSITAPTAAQVITVDHVTVTWTVSEETAYRIVLKTNPGGAAMFDTTVVTSTATTVVPAYTLANGSGWTIELTTFNNEGLASTVQTRNFSVSFITPMVPTLVASPLPTLGVIRVAITNPAPSGGAPAVSSQDLYRRKTGTTTTVRVAAALASGATADDFRAVSGQPYEFQVLVTGVNGTSTTSAWTA